MRNSPWNRRTASRSYFASRRGSGLNRVVATRLAHAGLSLLIVSQVAAAHRTENFVVVTPGEQMARDIGAAAESYRSSLALQWFGKRLAAWREPCVIVASVGSELASSGKANFVFHGGTAVDWKMSIRGSRQAVLHSVLPHEMAHAVFATHFGRRLPRWLEEGACMSGEDAASRRPVEELWQRMLVAGQVISIERLFAIEDYPRDVLPVYAQANSLTQFLVQRRGKEGLVRYFEQTLDDSDWRTTLPSHYDYQSLSDLENAWLEWASSPAPAETVYITENNSPVTH